MTQRVWYAAYGSNLLWERFEVYLTGGPIPGATDGRHQRGARDRSPPADDRPLLLTHSLYFALRSAQWGDGGVAFVDPVPSASPASRPTLGRAWNITVEQLADVYGQENRAAEVIELDLDHLAEAGARDLLDANYGRLIHLGHLDELPVVTFTAATRHRETNPADESYLDVIRRGLGECWDLGPQQIEEYLGVANRRREDPGPDTE